MHEELLRRAKTGDEFAVSELFELYRERLQRGIQFRIDPRLRGRLDDSDVMQETFIEVSKGIDAYLEDPQTPLFLWLRTIAQRKLFALHRHHLGTQARDAKRDVPIYCGMTPEATSACLAARLMGKLTTASQTLARAELQVRVRAVLNGMDATDREVLALRHFEQLSNAETANVLSINESTASTRYLRALKRLKQTINQSPGDFQ